VRTDALIVLAPILEGQVDAVRTVVTDLPRDGTSPFARVPGTHVARLTVIDALEDRRLEPDPASDSYLLFSTDFDGDVAPHVERLRTTLGARADAIWGGCAGYPTVARPEAFRDWVMEHRVPVGFSVAPYRDTAVEDVRAALDTRRRLVEFELAAADLDPEQLKAAWLDRFGDGHGTAR
jgi:hypothetical protein